MKLFVAGGAALLLSLAASSAFAADGCAVSAVNGKVSASAATVDTGSSDELFGLTGVVSAPIGCRLGAQADFGGLFSNGQDRTFAGGHLFLRDPSKYLVGVTGGWLDGGAAPNLSFAGIEGEYYTDRWTVSALAGAANLPAAIDDELYGLTVAYYPTDNIKLSVGNLHAFGGDLGNIRGEWQPQGRNFSLFADVSDDLSSVKLTTIRVGGTWHFGAAGKSLKDRNRQDDPVAVAGTFGEWYNLTADQIGVLQSGGGALPVPVNGVCPPGFFYVPSLSTTQCFL